MSISISMSWLIDTPIRSAFSLTLIYCNPGILSPVCTFSSIFIPFFYLNLSFFMHGVDSIQFLIYYPKKEAISMKKNRSLLLSRNLFLWTRPGNRCCFPWLELRYQRVEWWCLAFRPRASWLRPKWSGGGWGRNPFPYAPSPSWGPAGSTGCPGGCLHAFRPYGAGEPFCKQDRYFTRMVKRCRIGTQYQFFPGIAGSVKITASSRANIIRSTACLYFTPAHWRASSLYVLY